MVKEQIATISSCWPSIRTRRSMNWRARCPSFQQVIRLWFAFKWIRKSLISFRFCSGNAEVERFNFWQKWPGRHPLAVDDVVLEFKGKISQRSPKNPRSAENGCDGDCIFVRSKETCWIFFLCSFNSFILFEGTWDFIVACWCIVDHRIHPKRCWSKARYAH